MPIPFPPPPVIHVAISLEGLPPDPDVEAIKQGFERGLLMVAQFAKGLWIRRAQQLDIRHTGQYIRGIESAAIKITGKTEGSQHWGATIEITNRAPHASIVEDGHGAFSLVQAIDWGRVDGKIKRGKDGEPYLNIPFRHTTYQPASARASSGMTSSSVARMMPHHITEAARSLERTQRRNKGPQHEWRKWSHGPGTPGSKRHAVHGQWYRQHLAADRYHWGGRLHRAHTTPRFIMGGSGQSAGGPGEPGFSEHRSARQVGRDRGGNPLMNPAWKSSKYHGLFKSGPKGHSQYTTIRTITPRSMGWNIPAQAGYGVARQVASVLGGAMSERINKLFEAGFRSGVHL